MNGDILVQVGVELGLSAFETNIQSLIAMKPELKKANEASAAGVTFVGIEMVAQVRTLDASTPALL